MSRTRHRRTRTRPAPCPQSWADAQAALNCFTARLFATCSGSERYRAMWDFTVEILSGGGIQRFILLRDGATASFHDALRAWRDDEVFRDLFTNRLASTSFCAFRWEMPPVRLGTVDRVFEFVLLDDGALDRTPDPNSFREQFDSARDSQSTVVSFPNLGNDAILVVPRPMGPAPAYGHLAAFVRHAPEAQKHDLLCTVAAKMQARLDDRPVWLNTAGMGVPWLHVRLDNRPKYYRYSPYAKQ